MIDRFLKSLLFVSLSAISVSSAPNIIYVFCDDLGYGDLGLFYQNSRDTNGNGIIDVGESPFIHTPNLDTLAREGMMLTRHYVGSPVCAPSRGSLLSGRDQGHANVRDNSFDKALENNHTLGTVLKQAGYATACIGKWGLQGTTPQQYGSSDVEAFPTKRGFDLFFGYLDHSAGHRHYPKEDGAISSNPLVLWENTTNITAQADKCYSTDLFTARAKKWIMDHEASAPEQPFFLYLAYTAPHAALEVPTQAYPSYTGANNSLTGGMQWLGTPGSLITTANGTVNSYIYPEYAAYDPNGALARHGSMVRRLDDAIGDLKHLLADLDISTNTLVLFSSDNGPHHEGGYGVVAIGPDPVQDPQNFRSYANMDGVKRDMWEAGIRTPTIAWWPDHIDNGDTNAPIVSSRPCSAHDWMPTLADAAGVVPPAWSTGVSLLPELTGTGTQHDKGYLYFEYLAGGFNTTPSYTDFDPSHRGQTRNQMQTIFMDDPSDGIRYKGVRYNVTDHSQNFRIYNVDSDPQETTDLAASHTALQQMMKDKVLQVRIDGDYPRAYMTGEYAPPATPGATVNGLEYKAYTGSYDWVPETAYLTADTNGTCSGLDLAVRPQDDNIVLEYTGYISLPADGTYTFSMTTDSSVGDHASGGMLWIHEANVIADDFNHDGTARSGSMRLKAGLHPIRILYKHATGTHDLTLSYSGPGIALQPVPASALYIETATLPAPAAYWDFEEGSGSNTVETVSSTMGDVFGSGVVWSNDTGAPNSTASLGFPGTLAGNFGVNLSGQDVGIDGSNAKTIMGWIKTSSSGSTHMFFGWTPSDGSTAGADLRLGLDASGYLRFEVTSGFAFYNTTALNDGNWHMVAVVIDADDNVNSVQFYIDGSMLAPTSAGDRLINTQATGTPPREEIYLGIGNPQGTQQWNGMLDDVAVFTKALTEAELDAIMTNGVPWSPVEPSAPVWQADPIAGNPGTVGTPYSGTLADLASDPNGDPITFSRTSEGPTWLVVATNGILSGTPTTGDIGTNSFTVIADDFVTGSSTSTLQIVVSGFLKAYWDFEEGAGHTATRERLSSTQSDAIADSWSTNTAAPGSHNAYSLNGTRIGSNLGAADVGIAGSGAKTIIAWIKTTSTTESAFFDWTPTGGIGVGQDIRLLLKNGGIRMEVSSGGFEVGGLGLTDGNWHMLAFVVNAGDGINDVDYYIDGNYTTRSSGGTAINTASTGSYNLEIGFGNEQTGNRGYTGLLDDVAIYNKALTEAELDEIMAQGVIPSPPIPVTDLAIAGAVGGNAIVLSWTGANGSTYGVETNGNLSGGNWGTYLSNISGNGELIILTNSTGDAQMFYRIRSE